jgi:hypothetical protein
MFGKQLASDALPTPLTRVGRHTAGNHRTFPPLVGCKHSNDRDYEARN